MFLSHQSIYFLAAVWHSHSDHLSTIEKDTNGEVLWVWCYPSTTASLRNLLLRKCCLTDENKLLHPFVFGQYRRTWFYITTVEVPDSSILKKVWLIQGQKKPPKTVYLKWFKNIRLVDSVFHNTHLKTSNVISTGTVPFCTPLWLVECSTT